MPLLEAAFDDFDASWLDAEPAPSAAGSAEQLSPDEQRRLRRKISNRESARRCRLRKQRHLEELRAESARLRSLNRDLESRAGALSYRCLLVRRANHRLRSESASLSRRLAELRREILFRQVLMTAAAPAPAGAHAGFGAPLYEQALASLIA
ncbi:ocs element-binding factor 1-like [Canna indica]|uniref:Ocs element-binding factor 1-like n=1 Tax=Canna indica TaxID=4628 RepID=A0AAQ3KHL2_9LILI|nr:ocs element-binding factor 1-like [Canna indica]